VMIDGTGFGDHLMLVAMGIDSKGEKHVLGVREGTTESEPSVPTCVRQRTLG